MAGPVQPVGQAVGLDHHHPAVGAAELLVDVPGARQPGELRAGERPSGPMTRG